MRIPAMPEPAKMQEDWDNTSSAWNNGVLLERKAFDHLKLEEALAKCAPIGKFVSHWDLWRPRNPLEDISPPRPLLK